MNLNQISFQLYTCRDLLTNSAQISETLKRLRAIGYTAVETYQLQIPDAELAKIIQQEGMVCSSTGQNPETIFQQPEAVLENLNSLGCDIVMYPSPIGLDFTSTESLQEYISKLQRSGEFLRKAGKTLAYHNHHLEFIKLGGKTVLEQIFDQATPEALQAEVDIYWLQYGGGDILSWIDRLSGRLPAIHLKDYQINAEKVPQFAELGMGTLNLPKIIAAAEDAGCKWFVVEQDTCPGDPVDSLAQSFRYLQELVKK